MSKEVTERTHCVIAKGIGRFWVTKDQADRIESALDAENTLVRIEGDVIRAKDINAVVSGNRIEELDREKRGEWQCKYGYWHERYQSCGHGDPMGRK